MKKRMLSVIFAAFMLGASVIGLGACGETPTSAGTPGNEAEQGGETNPGEGGTENGQQGGESQGGAPEVRTTVTEEEWHSALRMEGVRNVTVDGELAYVYPDMKMVYTIKTGDNLLYLDGRTRYGEDQEEVPGLEIYYEILETLDGGDEINIDPFFSGRYYANVFEKNFDETWETYQREFSWAGEKSPFIFITTFLGSFRFPYEQFTYNASLRQYEANNIVLTSLPVGSLQSPSMDVPFDSMVFQFQDGKLVGYEAKYSMEIQEETGAKFFSLTFSDYGTTNVTLPQVAEE